MRQYAIRSGAFFDEAIRISPRLPLRIPVLPYYATPYINLGSHPDLELSQRDGAIDGVFIRPYRTAGSDASARSVPEGNPEDEFEGVTPRFQVLVCASPVTSIHLETLEDWSTLISQVCCATLVSGELHIVDGDYTLVGDPAIELASRIALRAFVENLKKLNQSAPPKPVGVIITL